MINFNDFSDEDLDKLILEAYQERDRRVKANIQKRKLEEFLKNDESVVAFNALIESGHDIAIYDNFISNFDDFEIS